MEDNIIKKQHYIPRTYLRQFSKINGNNEDKKNKIFVFDKSRKRSYGSNVYDIACENLFYDFENISTVKERQIFENAFSEIETKFAVMLKKIRGICEDRNNYFNALITTKEERDEFSFYIMLQLIRTKKYRNIVGNLTYNAMESIMRFYKEQYLGEEFNENSKGYKIDNKVMHLKTLSNSEYTMALTNFISNSNWMFIKNETQIPFIISDNPVCRIPRYYKSEIYGERISSIFSDDLQIYFPLSPNVVLYVFRDKIPNFEKFRKCRNRLVSVNDIKMVNIINEYQCIMAHERIFVNPDYKGLIEEYCEDDLLKDINLLF